jgi:hypothetical protein
MAKQVSMSTVKLEVPSVTTAPEFRVMEDKKIVGDLRVSKGGVFWRSKGLHQYYHLNWEQMDSLFKANGELRPVGEYNISSAGPGGFDDAAELRSEALRQP